MKNGFSVVRDVFPQGAMVSLRNWIVSLCEKISGSSFRGEVSIDEAWRTLSRPQASLLYNAMKNSVICRDLSVGDYFQRLCGDMLGSSHYAFVDTNFRIDAPGGGNFLFNWHQDYWFSMCSTDGLVAWIPLMDVDDEIGGLEVLPYPKEGRKLYAARRGSYADSYADSIVLNEDVDTSAAVKPTVKAGDVLFFRFDTLHRSLPNVSRDRCRWTLLLRMVSFTDPQFASHDFKPGVVSKQFISYFDGPKQ
jgi:hypothetical protein